MASPEDLKFLLDKFGHLLNKDVGDTSPKARTIYGYVKPEERGAPPGYKPKPLEHMENHSTKNDYPDEHIVITSQPSQPLNATFASVPDNWAECMISGKTKRIILSTKGFPQPIARPPDGKDRCEIKSSRYGLGMFATKDLNTGDLILAERPLMVTPAGLRSLPDFDLGWTQLQMTQAVLFEWERQLQVLFGRMTKENQEAFMALHNSHELDGSGPIGGRIRTNGFELKGLQDHEGPQGAYSGVFNKLSRLNHSCGPNTTRHFDLPSFSMRLHAVRPVKRGEELTLSYCEVVSLTEYRQKDLEPYGFQCSCSSCRNPRFSDARRIRLLAIVIERESEGARYNAWLEGRTSDAKYISDLTGNIKIFEEEGVQGSKLYLKELKKLLDVYVALGDGERAVEVGRKMGMWYLADGGSDILLKRLVSVETHRASKNWGVKNATAIQKNGTGSKRRVK